MSDERNTEIIIERVKKAISWALTLLIAASAFLVVYATIQSRNGKAVSLFGRYFMKIVTGSMEPTLKEGDFIIVRSAAPDELNVGDVISFYSEEDDVRGKIVTHRIVKINPDGSFVTRGDANDSPDKKPVRSDQIIGKYARKARYMRWMSSFADKKKLLLLLVIIPTTLMAIYEVRTIAKISREAEKETSPEDIELLMREAIDKEKERLARENYSPDDEDAHEEDNSAVPPPPEEDAEDGGGAEEDTEKEAETIESGKDNEEENDRSDNTLSDNADSSDNLHSPVRRRDEEGPEDV